MANEEYDVISHSTDEMVDHLAANNPNSTAGVLLDNDLLSREYYDDLVEDKVASTKARKIAQGVTLQIKAQPSNFKKFIKVLKKEGLHGLADILEGKLGKGSFPAPDELGDDETFTDSVAVSMCAEECYSSDSRELCKLDAETVSNNKEGKAKKPPHPTAEAETSSISNQTKRTGYKSVDTSVSMRAHNSVENKNFTFILIEYVKLLQRVSKYLDEKKYKFDRFVDAAEFVFFPKGLSEGESTIYGYLSKALRQGKLSPLGKLWGYDALEATLETIYDGNMDIFHFYDEYNTHLDSYSTLENILETLKTDDGEYVLCLHQFEELKHKDKDKFTLKVNVSREIKGKSLMHFKKTWNSFLHQHCLAPVPTVLEYIRERKCFEITWLILPILSSSICIKAPLSSDYFHAESITRVSINGESIFQEDIHGSQDITKAQVNLLEASERGKHMEVKALLKVPGVDLDFPDAKTGRTALMLAAHYGHMNIASTLIQYKASINIKEENSGWSALVFAADRGHEDLVKMLLHHGGNVLTYDENETLLLDNIDASPQVYEIIINATVTHLSFLEACEIGEMDEVKSFLEDHLYINVNTTTKEGKTPLILAAQNGHKEIVISLLQYPKIKADVNIQEHIFGKTALFCAAESGHEDVIEVLLSHETDSLICDNNGKTALDIVQNDKSNIYLWLSQATLVAAAKTENFELVKRMVSLGVDPDAIETDQNLYSALLWACQNGNRNIVDFLLEKGANLNYESASNWTGLILASRGGYKQIVETLLNKGVDVDKKNEKGWTALLYAASKGNKELAKLLLNKGATPDIPDKNGFTPLVQAAQNGHFDIIELLLERNPRIDIQHKSNHPEDWTAVMQATKNGHEKIVHFLIEKGADMHWKSKDGVSILHIACYKGYKDLVQYFCEKEMNVNDQDKDGLTPLIYAAKQGHLKVIDILIENKAKINLSDINIQWTAVFYAMQSKHQPVFEFLIESDKVDLSHKDVHGNTLGELSLIINKEAFKYLIKKYETSIKAQLKMPGTPKSLLQIKTDRSKGRYFEKFIYKKFTEGVPLVQPVLVY